MLVCDRDGLDVTREDEPVLAAGALGQARIHLGQNNGCLKRDPELTQGPMGFQPRVRCGRER